MANWSNPTLTSLYTDFVTEVKNRDVDLALGLDPATTSPTNVPANAIRWNSASFKYQKWDGSTWNDLSAKYIFTSVEVSGATVPVNGMYLSTTNTLNFSTASTASRLTIDGNGNVNIDSGTFYVDAVNNRVGVGTTGPSYAFDVANTVIQVGTSTDAFVQYKSTAGNWHVGVTSGGAYNFYTGTYGTGAFRMSLDASGNLGLGVVPSAWAGLAYKAIEVGAVGNALFGGTNDFEISANAYYASGWKYGSANPATVYVQYNGQHQWKTSTNTPSTNGAITFTQSMTLDASGRLGIGTTAPYASLEVQGTQQTHTGVSSQVGPITAYNTTNNADTAAVRTVLSLMRAGKSGVSYGSQANFNIGRYSQANANANTQLNLRLANGVTNDPDNDVMTWLGDGRVGIGTTSPVATLHSRTDNAGSGSTPLLIQNRSVSANTAVGISFAPNTSDTADRSAVIYGVNSSGGTGNATDLAFHTNANGGSPTEKARINSLGYMQGTVNGLGAGRIPAKQYYRLNSSYTGTDGTAAQAIYGVGVTLVSSTVYEFEAIYALARNSGTTSHTMSFLFGGTATVNNIFYTGVGPGYSTSIPPLTTFYNYAASFVSTSASAAVASPSMTLSGAIFYIVKGTVSINSGGTFIPQYQLSAAPGGAYSTYAGAYFSIWPLAASGSAVNIGSWA